MGKKDIVDSEFHKLKNTKRKNPCCGKCQKEITEQDLGRTEIIKTKRGDQSFYHRECIYEGL